MRIDNAKFTGSALGSQANANLTGSFTGSGHIELSSTGSYNFASASISASSIIFHRADTAVGITASIDVSEVGTDAVTGSVIRGLTQSFFKGDNTSYENYIELSGSTIEGVTFRDAIVTGSFSGSFTGTVSGSLTNAESASVADKTSQSLQGGLGINGITSTVTFDGSVTRIVNVNTASTHFINGASQVTASSLVGTPVVNQDQITFVRGDGTNAVITLDSASFTTTASTAVNVGRKLTNGALVDAFTFDGSAAATVNISTFSASVSTDITSLSSSADAAREALSGSIAAQFSGSTTPSASAASTAVSASSAVNAVSASSAQNAVSASSAQNAVSASSAQNAVSASSAQNAVSASSAQNAVSASSAQNAVSASSAQNAVSASSAQNAVSASSAQNAVSASSAQNAVSASSAFNAVSASSAQNAVSASSAQNAVSASSAQNAVSASSAQNAVSASSAQNAVSASSAQNAVSASSAQNAVSASSAQNAVSASSAQNAVSASSAANATSASRAAIAGQVQYSLTQGALVDAFTFNGSAPATVNINTYSGSANTARRNYVSGAALLAGREEDTIRLTRGNGSVDDVTFVTSSFVKTVNTSGPDAQGNVAISLASVRTGTSASMLAAIGTFQDGDVWVISGQSGSDPSAGSASNGVTFIYAATGSILLEIASLTEIAADSKYVNTSGDTMTGQLVLPAANPTLANQATRKGYVDTFYNAESVDDARSEVTLTKGDGTSDIVSLAGISVSSSVSASNVGVADGRRITATTNPTQNFITLNDGGNNAEIGVANNLDLNINTDGGAVGQIDFQNNGTSVATINQDGTGSFAWVNATASVAQRVRHDLVDGTGVDNFAYDGNQPATVSIATYSASAATSLTNVINGTTPISSTTSASFASTAQSASAARNALSASAAQNAVSSSTAIRVGKKLIDGTGVDNFTFDGSAAATVSIATYSASAATDLTNVINGTTTIAGTIANATSASSAATAVSASSAINAVSASHAINALSASAAQNAVSASSAQNAVSASSAINALSASSAARATSASRAAIAGQVQYNLVDGVGVDNFTFNGSAPATVSINTFSASIVSNLDNVKNGTYVLQSASFAGSASGLHPGAGISLAGQVTSSAPVVFDGSGNISINLGIAADSVVYDKLGASFTARDNSAATALDFNAFTVFDKSLTANTTFTFTNQRVGDVKHLVIDCNGFTPTLPATFTLVGGGTFDTTAGTTNLVSILCNDGTNFVGTILSA